jgi:hypothetical protein
MNHEARIMTSNRHTHTTEYESCMYTYIHIHTLIHIHIHTSYMDTGYWSSPSLPVVCCSTTARVVHHRDPNLHTPTYTYTATHPSVFVFEIETHIFTSLFGFIFKFDFDILSYFDVSCLLVEGCGCNGRLQTKRSTRLPHTGLVVGWSRPVPMLG